MGDDLGITSLAGQPNYESLKLTGTSFTTHYTYPLCTPSRAGFLTGRDPVRSDSLDLFNNGSPNGMETIEITLGNILSNLGLDTTYLGKWHLGEPDIYKPSARGFFLSYWWPISLENLQPYRIYTDNVLTTSLDKNSVAGKARLKQVTIEQQEWAVSYLENVEGSFYFHISSSMYHIPHQCFSKLPGENTDTCALRELDNFLGAVINSLPPDTYFLFIGDNGATAISGNGSLHGNKSSYYNGGTTTPAILVGPGIPIQVITDPISIMDWFPTFVSLFGGTLPVDRVIDGKNIMPLILGTGTRPGGNRFWLSGSLRDGCNKFVKKGHDAPADELYNVCTDVNETTILSNPALLASMKALHISLKPHLGLN